MARVNIVSKICNLNDNKTDLINVSAINTDNKYVFLDKKTTVTVYLYDDMVDIQRKNDEYIIELHFEIGNSYGKYNLLNYNRVFNFSIDTTFISINDNYIEIKYELENDQLFKFYFEIKK